MTDELPQAPGATANPIRKAEAVDPYLGLVLLHAAVLDPRLKHITVFDVLPSYRMLINRALPLRAPQDILPGVLRQYDIPDLVRVLGDSLTIGGKITT